LPERRIHELASELADTAVLDVAGSTGQGTGLVPELAQVRAAHKLALAAVEVAFSRYREEALSRALPDKR
jgi:hypothetical protein